MACYKIMLIARRRKRKMPKNMNKESKFLKFLFYLQFIVDVPKQYDVGRDRKKFNVKHLLKGMFVNETKSDKIRKWMAHDTSP